METLMGKNCYFTASSSKAYSDAVRSLSITGREIVFSVSARSFSYNLLARSFSARSFSQDKRRF